MQQGLLLPMKINVEEVRHKTNEQMLFLRKAYRTLNSS